MRAVRDLFYVRADAEQETKHKFKNGHEIYISEPIATLDKEKEFSPYERAVQVAEIVCVPMRISKGYVNNFPLKEGDKIYVHHFVIQPDNYDEIDGEKLYRCMYENIFCVIRDGELLPVQDYVFLTSVLEPEENYKTKSGIFLKTEPETLRNIGEIQFLCKQAEEQGLKKGDHVYWLDNSDYSMTIEGNHYWRMKLSRIVAKIV